MPRGPVEPERPMFARPKEDVIQQILKSKVGEAGGAVPFEKLENMASHYGVSGDDRVIAFLKAHLPENRRPKNPKPGS